MLKTKDNQGKWGHCPPTCHHNRQNHHHDNQNNNQNINQNNNQNHNQGKWGHCPPTCNIINDGGSSKPAPESPAPTVIVITITIVVIIIIIFIAIVIIVVIIFIVIVTIQQLEYTIPPLSCMSQKILVTKNPGLQYLGNRESYHRSAGVKTTGKKSEIRKKI